MSAITGIHHLKYDYISDDCASMMIQALHDFPADSIQIWRSKEIILGCLSQWITPESINEQLPYFDPMRKLAITADAIIDNRDELFNRLNIDHHLRKSMPDSQLILLAYEKWGEQTPTFLVGDFAFMIWDEGRKRLFGARDLSGYRTLYYHCSNNHFAFGTTIESLLSLPFVARELNEQWLAEYLAIIGTIDTVDAASTPYRSIMQLPPSHSITVERESVTVIRYGSLMSSDKLKLQSDGEYIEAFKEVFEQAVSCRLRTHRGIGSQLSGGLDSGSVVGFASKLLQGDNRTLHTFSYVPPSDFVDFTPRYLIADETPYIRSTVQHVGNVHAHYLDFEGKNSYDDIDDLLQVMEMPYKFFENSFWLKGMFESAQEHGIGVLLNGDQGNFTISWGDAFDYYAILLKKMRWLRLVRELHLYSANAGGARLRHIPLIARISFPLLDRIFPQEKTSVGPQLIDPAFAENTGVYTKLASSGFGRSGWVTAHNIYEERRTLFDNIFPWNTGNTLITKLSLRHALWKRDPTNDIRVIRFCLSVPEDQYVRNGMDRALIRRSTETILPDNVRLNQRVRGIQGADWLHRILPRWEAFRNDIREMRGNQHTMQYLNSSMIDSAMTKLQTKPRPEEFNVTEYRTLMRSLIVHRFLTKFMKGGECDEERMAKTRSGRAGYENDRRRLNWK